MKKLQLLLAVLLILLFTACKKEYSCEGCNDNKPPVAEAGDDITFILPKDSLLLDGSASSDPDGTIVSYQWTKINDTSSAKLSKPDSSKALVRNMAVGVYRILLTVTDDGGLSDTDTLQVTVKEAIQGNRPPIAHAGPDQIVVLPDNVVILSGTASNDPDNNITSYLWTKIAGPTPGTIANVKDVHTGGLDLVEGVYLFELKVTDAEGLFSRDTSMVTVVRADNSCSKDSLFVSNGKITFTPIGALTEPKYIEGAAVGDKIIFAGGGIEGSTTTASVDICNLSTRTWSKTRLNETRTGDIRSATVGNKLFIGSSNDDMNYVRKIDIYDATANTWSVSALNSQFPAMDNGSTMLAAGNKIFITDGNREGANGFSTTIDVYDAVTNAWSFEALSEPRTSVSAAVVGDKVIYAGGYRGMTFDDDPLYPSSRVDIYSLATNSWSTTELSEARIDMAVGIIGNKVFFAGGSNGLSSARRSSSNKVDIYNAATNTWSTAQLSEARSFAKAVTIGNKVIFAGGMGSSKVDIYDASSNTWSTASLTQARVVSSAAVLGNKVLFFTGWDELNANVLDVYDAGSNSWFGAQLNKSISSYVFSAGGRVFMGGGRIKDVGSDANPHYTCTVWEVKF